MAKLKVVETGTDGTYDEAAEKAGIILDMIRIREGIDCAADRVFEATHWPIARVRRMNEHLQDARKSIDAAVAALPKGGAG